MGRPSAHGSPHPMGHPSAHGSPHRVMTHLGHDLQTQHLRSTDKNLYSHLSPRSSPVSSLGCTLPASILHSRICTHCRTQSPSPLDFSLSPSVTLLHLGVGPHPSSLHSPIPDLHSVPSAPWAAPLQPPFSILRSPLRPFRPWAAPLRPPFSILRSALTPVAPWAAPLQPPFSDPRSALAPLPLGPRPSIFHSRISDLHSQATSQREAAVSRDGALVTRA